MKNLYFVCTFICCSFLMSAQTVTMTYGTNVGLPASPPSPFEVCVNMNVRFEFFNFSARFDYFDIPLKNGTFYRIRVPGSPNAAAAPNVNQQVNITTITPTCSPLPGSAPFCGRISFVVPTSGGGAISGPVRFYSVSNTQLAVISLTVQNPVVSLGAIDPSICSEDTIPLTVSPQGGAFSVSPLPSFAPVPTVADFIRNPTTAPWTNYDRIFVPNPAGPNNVITGPTNNRRNLTFIYTYTPRLSDNTACPATISDTQSTTVFANYPFVANFQSMPVARSWIENLMAPSPNGVLVPELGGLEHPVWVNRNATDIDFSYSGIYVDSLYYFRGDLLGQGNSALLTLHLNNRGCSASAGSFVSTQNPSTTIPSQYCQNVRDTLRRSDILNGPSYSSILSLEFNHLEITCSPYPGAMIAYTTIGGSEVYIFDPSSIPGGTSVTITFQYYSIFGGLRSDGTTLSFVTTIIGSSGIVPPASFPSNSIFCHNSAPVNLSAFAPNPDTIVIRALTGSQAGTIVAVLNASNTFTFVPSAIHPDSLNDTDYRLIFEGGPCGTVDSLTFRITGAINPYIVGRHANFTYCRNEPVDVLQYFPFPAMGSVTQPPFFSGHPSVDSLGRFDPANTGNGVAVFDITYNFTSIYGCYSSVTETFTVNPVPTISLSTSDANNQFCANDTIGYLFGIPTGGIYSGPTIQSTSDTSFLPNAIYIAGGFINTIGYADFYYIYQEPITGCQDTTDVRAFINPIPQPTFSIDPYFCEAHPRVELLGNPNVIAPTQNFFYAINGDTNVVNAGYYYPNRYYPNPLLANPRTDTIIYQVADSTPCIGRDTQIVTVFPNPLTSFVGVNTAGSITNQACLGQDTLRLTPIVTNATLYPSPGNFYFAGPGVLFNTDLFVADVAGVGPHLLTAYFYDTVSLSAGALVCRDTFVDTFYVHSTPNVEFSVDGGCGGVDMVFVPNNTILGLNRYYFGTTNLYDSITTVTWDFGDGNIVPGAHSAAPQPNRVDTATHLYVNPGVYITSLFVENRNYCFDSDTVRVIVLSNTQPLDTVPYFENFEASSGNWIEEAEGNNASSNLWSWGMAPGPRIRTNNDPEHLNVWTTNLLQRPYPQNAAGWVYSPCIDLTELDRPMLKLDYFNDTDPGNDGVVIEYYDRNLNVWRPLGDVNRGLNWYNYAVIAGRPGLQDLAPKGWSGLSAGWKDGRYKLDDFKSYEDFRFRIAFGAVGVSGTYEGFAFDNVWIGNRTRNVLLEHFSNVGVTNFDAMNNHVYDLIYGTSLVYDVVLAQFNTEGPSTDQFNQSNSADVSGRVFSYGGFEQSGKVAIDGKRFSAISASNDLQEIHFEQDMLESPKFDIQLNNVQIFAGTVQATALVTANEDMPFETYYVQMLVLEDSMSYFSGERVHSVMRKMMPNAAGTDFQRAWVTGDQGTATESWTFNTANYNAQNMNVIAFIEVDGSDEREIFQVISTRDITAYADALGTPEAEAAVAASQEILNMNLYPNPTTSQITIEFDAPLSKDFNWEIYDLLGRRLQGGIANEGTQKMNVEGLDNWAEGAYLFIVRDPKFTVQKKFVVRR